MPVEDRRSLLLQMSAEWETMSHSRVTGREMLHRSQEKIVNDKVQRTLRAQYHERSRVSARVRFRMALVFPQNMSRCALVVWKMPIMQEGASIRTSLPSLSHSNFSVFDPEPQLTASPDRVRDDDCVQVVTFKFETKESLRRGVSTE